MSGGGSIDAISGSFTAPSVAGSVTVQVTDSTNSSTSSSVTINEALGVSPTSLTSTLYTQKFTDWDNAHPAVARASEVTSILLQDGRVFHMRYGSTSVEIFNPATGTWFRAASLPESTNYPSIVLLSSGKIMVAGGNQVIGKTTTILTKTHIYDPAMNTWSPGPNLNTGRYNASILRHSSGKVIIMGGVDASLASISSVEVYDPATNVWTVKSSMNNARKNSSATLLADGNVLVAGGANGETVLSSSEIYNPTTDSWAIVGNLITARWLHSSAILPDGRVLTMGGHGDVSSTTLSSTEIFNPGSQTWSSGPALSSATGYPRSVILPDGKVMLSINNTSTVALFDPATNSWSPLPSMNIARTSHSLTLLSDGSVMAYGGTNSLTFARAQDTAEIYSFISSSWSVIEGSLTTFGKSKIITTLLNGKVLCISTSSSGAISFLYDPLTDTIGSQASLPVNLMTTSFASAVLLDGRVLVAGGSIANPSNSYSAINAAQIYDPSTNTWATTGSMSSSRAFLPAVTLQSGKVLVIGGTIGVTKTTELYDPSTGTWSPGGSFAYSRSGNYSAVLLQNGKVLEKSKI